MRKLLIALLLLMGIWFVFDGTWALVTGSYTSPSAGEFAGQLGPWTAVVEASGMEPLGYPVRIGHVIAGIISLAGAFTIAAGWGTLAWVIGYLAVATMLWYVPFGTAMGVLSAVLLSLPSVRVEIRGR